MCGIFGMGFLKKNVDMVVMSSVLKKLIELSRVRGTDATGLAFTTKNDISVLKHNVDASKFVKLKEYGCEISKFMAPTSPRLYSVLGHCRDQTKGSHTNPLNNHPIPVGDIVGVHNGIVTNDDTIFEKFSADISRLGEVDSEAMFSIINHYSESLKNDPDEFAPTTKAIIKATGTIKGSFACGVVDAASPHNLWIFRNNNPVVIMHFRKEGVVLFASTLPILRAAIENTDFEDPDEVILKTNQGVCMNLLSATYNVFELKEYRVENGFTDY